MTIFTHGACDKCGKHKWTDGRRSAGHRAYWTTKPVRRRAPLIFRWRAGPKRRLKHARCPHCNGWLRQTCFANLKHYIMDDGEPWFDHKED